MSLFEPRRSGRTVTTGTAPVTDAAAGRVRVMSDRCATCDFRPGNRGNLAPGQLAGLVGDCLADEGHIVCHESGHTADRPGAVCAGFAAHPHAGRSLALRLAAVGLTELQDAEGHFVSIDVEYGIASTSDAEIEPLGQISRSSAEAIVTDSQRQWPDVYLVQRTGSGNWQQPPAD